MSDDLEEYEEQITSSLDKAKAGLDKVGSVGGNARQKVNNLLN